MLALLADSASSVERRAENTVALRGDGAGKTARRRRRWPSAIRASFLRRRPAAGALRRGADMPPPGGDVIGRRRLDPHLDAFRALGADVEHGRDIDIQRARRRPAGRATSSWTSRP